MGELESDVVRDKPVHHRRESPELRALDGAAVQVGVPKVGDEFLRFSASLSLSENNEYA